MDHLAIEISDLISVNLKANFDTLASNFEDRLFNIDNKLNLFLHQFRSVSEVVDKLEDSVNKILDVCSLNRVCVENNSKKIDKLIKYRLPDLESCIDAKLDKVSSMVQETFLSIKELNVTVSTACSSAIANCLNSADEVKTPLSHLALDMKGCRSDSSSNHQQLLDLISSLQRLIEQTLNPIMRPWMWYIVASMLHPLKINLVISVPMIILRNLRTVPTAIFPFLQRLPMNLPYLFSKN